MIDSATYTNLETGANYTLNSDTVAFTDFEVSITSRLDRSRQKAGAHGIWPTYNYYGEMEIHIEGDLISDTAADYNAMRAALILALRGDPNNATSGPRPQHRFNGTLVLQMTGQSEEWQATVGIDAFSAPQTGGNPAYSTFLITFVSPDPWFTGVTTQTKYYWS